jgi:hypothetical protein
MPVPGGPRISVVVVMPTLTAGDQGDERVVATVLPCLVVAVAPEVAQRIHRPCDVPDQHGPHEYAPDQQTGAELERLRRGTAGNERRGDADNKKAIPWATTIQPWLRSSHF